MKPFTKSPQFARYKTLKSREHESRSLHRDISDRWEKRVVANGWDTFGEFGANEYVKQYGNHIGEPKLVALALLAERKGVTDFSERIWEVAFEKFSPDYFAFSVPDFPSFDDIPASLQPSAVFPPPPSYPAAVSCVVFANTEQVLAIDENHEPAQLPNDLNEALALTSRICPPFVIRGELLPAKANNRQTLVIPRALFSDYSEISDTETAGNAEACDNLLAYITASLPVANPDVEVVLDLAA